MMWKYVKVLTEKGTDSSPGGWWDLMRGGEISADKVDGAYRFSMMRGELGEKTASFIDWATQ